MHTMFRMFALPVGGDSTQDETLEAIAAFPNDSRLGFDRRHLSDQVTELPPHSAIAGIISLGTRLIHCRLRSGLR